MRWHQVRSSIARWPSPLNQRSTFSSCYCIELGLKAICLHAGMAENTVGNIGHDLARGLWGGAAVGGVPRCYASFSSPMRIICSMCSDIRRRYRHSQSRTRLGVCNQIGISSMLPPTSVRDRSTDHGHHNRPPARSSGAP